jgi:hypothetical protein
MTARALIEREPNTMFARDDSHSLCFYPLGSLLLFRCAQTIAASRAVCKSKRGLEAVEA